MYRINDFDVLVIAAYLSIWTSLYFLLGYLRPCRSHEWHCRTVTVFHAVTVTLMSAYGMFVLGPSPFTHAGGPNSPFQVNTVSLCLGYFLFDFSWCLYFKTEGPVMMTHHLLSIVGLAWCLFSGFYGTELVATIGGAEVTNPLLQLRWFLRETGYYRTMLGDAVDWAFIVSFGFIRILLGSILLYSYYQQNTDFWGRFGGTCIYSIGWIFFIGIINYAFRKYTKRYRTWQSPPAPAKGAAILKHPEAQSSLDSDGDTGAPAQGSPTKGKNSFCAEDSNKNSFCAEDSNILSVREIKSGSSGLFARNVSHQETILHHTL